MLSQSSSVKPSPAQDLLLCICIHHHAHTIVSGGSGILKTGSWVGNHASVSTPPMGAHCGMRTRRRCCGGRPSRREIGLSWGGSKLNGNNLSGSVMRSGPRSRRWRGKYVKLACEARFRPGVVQESDVRLGLLRGQGTLRAGMYMRRYGWIFLVMYLLAVLLGEE